MYTKEELIEIRNRAELEAMNDTQNLIWRTACLDLAKAAERLDSVHNRICQGSMTSLSDGWPKPQPSIVA